MSPVRLAINTIAKAITSFHPASMPRLSRGHYRRELAVWSLLPVALGAVEGGVTGVLAKNAFEGTVGPVALSLAVAVLQGAPALANIVSFLWAALGHGRNKIRLIATLQLLMTLMVAMIALAPRNGTGLLILVVGAVGARMSWAGVVTLRSTVWRANYPRHARATLAGKLATVQAILMAATAFAIGQAMNVNPEAFRIMYPAAAGIGLIGVVVYSGMRMRGHRAVIRAELDAKESSASLFNPLRWRALLLEDAKYRRYMTCMFVFGAGNLMVGAPLIIMLKDRFQFSESTSVAIMTTIPLLLMPLSIPLWSRLLDRVHILQFRAIHSWAFVASTATVLIAALTMQPWLLFLAASLKGFAFGGGVLAWNLGHHDFAPVEKASQYMGVHVTLTGIRGLLAPIVGVSVYEALEWLEPGAGAWVFAICLSLTIIGAVWFVLMRRTLAGRGVGADFEAGPPVQPPAAA